MQKNVTAGISGSYIRDEHKKMTGDYKDLWTFQFEHYLHT